MNRRQCIALAGAAALGRVVPVSAAGPAARYEAALAACTGFNGTVAVGQGARIRFSTAVGFADPQAATPMAVDTRFEAGSVSKWIAAMVVLKLVDDGKLALDEPIARYLPDYRADTGGRITLRHLMSHSSGVPNDIVAARKADPQVGLVPLEQMEAVRRFASGDLRFAPGSAWDYSHSNWLIVKAIVERASGKRYRDCVAAWLLEPLQLRDSGIFSGESSDVPGMAVAYAGLAPPFQRKVTAVPDYLAMAGGFYSSAPDMVRLMDGVLGGGILGPASRAALVRVIMPDQHYALGGRTRIETIAGKAREAAWEDGANGGFRLVARRVLADGASVVVFNNGSHDHRTLGLLASALMEAAYG
ncbi:serine hydrolase domain-containing protein [Pseudoduganella dura]|uniref:serine hydrolase domain-containing protein n=1 Tax=Pseudoduganella dura TaxID=321982 RepID=UPI001C12B831|nr:serine hydrolase domain-containing protein [Pseudoduganella dura]